MIALTGFLAVVLLAMLAAPAPPFARLCHRELVERPIAALAKFRSHHLLYAVILVPVLLSGGEFVAILGPEFFAAYAMELAVYFDALIVTLALSVRAQAQVMVQHVRMRILQPRGQARRRRSAPSVRVQRSSANDDDCLLYTSPSPRD